MKIIISGIDYSNYGSIAMLNQALSALKKNRCKIIEISSSKIKKKYSPRELKNTVFFRVRHLLLILLIPDFFLKKINNDDLRKINLCFSKNSKLYDISGFVLSDKFKFFSWIRFLLPILITIIRGGNVVIVPQSFGPFKSIKIKLICYLLRLMILSNKIIVYTRDNESKEFLKERKINAKVMLDTVFATDVKLKRLKQIKNSIGIVPNFHLFEIFKKEEVFQAYINIIKVIGEKKMNVVIFNHTSVGDENISKWLIEECKKYKLKVSYIRGPISQKKLLDIYSQLNCLVSSRFHSIVFGFLSNLPCLIIGWSNKYKNLAHLYKQTDNCYEPKNVNIKKFKRFLSNLKIESKKISEISHKVNKLAKNNLKRIYSL